MLRPASGAARRGIELAATVGMLSWAAKAGAWIIEDDYDSEFRYGSRPLPALKSLDESGRVLYVGSFSKVLFPGVRLGYLVVPHAQVERVSRVCQLLYRDRAVFMRALYEVRRAALAAALTEICGKQLTIQLQAGGMHLLARFADFRSDLDLVARASSRGLAPAAFSPWKMEPARADRGILLSFTNTPPQSAREMALRLRGVL